MTNPTWEDTSANGVTSQSLWLTHNGIGVLGWLNYYGGGEVEAGVDYGNELVFHQWFPSFDEARAAVGNYIVDELGFTVQASSNWNPEWKDIGQGDYFCNILHVHVNATGEDYLARISGHHDESFLNGYVKARVFPYNYSTGNPGVMELFMQDFNSIEEAREEIEDFFIYELGYIVGDPYQEFNKPGLRPMGIGLTKWLD